MLDTNAVSQLMRSHPAVLGHVLAVPMASLCMSSITAGELLFGIAKRPEARRLHDAVREILRRVDALPWDATIAERYGKERADLESRGRILGPLDQLIAAHALAVNAILVTNDRAFQQVTGLKREDWTLA